MQTDSRAADSAGAVNADAYAVGPHIVFGGGRYQPRDPAGQRLLARDSPAPSSNPVPASRTADRHRRLR